MTLEGGSTSPTTSTSPPFGLYLIAFCTRLNNAVVAGPGRRGSQGNSAESSTAGYAAVPAPELIDDLTRQLLEVDAADAHGDAAGLDSAQVEQVGDEAVQPVALLFDVARDALDRFGWPDGVLARQGGGRSS